MEQAADPSIPDDGPIPGHVWNEWSVHVSSCDWEAIRVWCRDGSALSLEARQRRFLLALTAEAAQRSGDSAAAESLAAEVLATESSDDGTDPGHVWAIAVNVQGLARWSLGDLEGADALLARVEEWGASSSDGLSPTDAEVRHVLATNSRINRASLRLLGRGEVLDESEAAFIESEAADLELNGGQLGLLRAILAMGRGETDRAEELLRSAAQRPDYQESMDFRRIGVQLEVQLLVARGRADEALARIEERLPVSSPDEEAQLLLMRAAMVEASSPAAALDDLERSGSIVARVRPARLQAFRSSTSMQRIRLLFETGASDGRIGDALDELARDAPDVSMVEVLVRLIQAPLSRWDTAMAERIFARLAPVADGPWRHEILLSGAFLDLQRGRTEEAYAACRRVVGAADADERQITYARLMLLEGAVSQGHPLSAADRRFLHDSSTLERTVSKSMVLTLRGVDLYACGAFELAALAFDEAARLLQPHELAIGARLYQSQVFAHLDLGRYADADAANLRAQRLLDRLPPALAFGVLVQQAAQFAGFGRKELALRLLDGAGEVAGKTPQPALVSFQMQTLRFQRLLIQGHSDEGLAQLQQLLDDMGTDTPPVLRASAEAMLARWTLDPYRAAFAGILCWRANRPSEAIRCWHDAARWTQVTDPDFSRRLFRRAVRLGRGTARRLPEDGARVGLLARLLPVSAGFASFLATTYPAEALGETMASKGFALALLSHERLPPADDVRARWPAGVVGLEYLLWGGEVVVFVVRRGHPVEVRRHPWSRADAEALDEAATGLRAAAGGSTDPWRLWSALHRLRRALWDPVADVLADAQGVCLSPGARLSRVPWEALPLDDQQPVITRWWIQFVPTLAHAIPAPRTLDPLSKPPIWLATRGDDDAAGGSPLDAADGELERTSRLARRHGWEVTTGPTHLQDGPSNAASMIEKATVWHYAGHARTFQDDPMAATLYLPGRPLAARDVLHLDLRRLRLCILSGCATEGTVDVLRDAFDDRPPLTAPWADIGDELTGFLRALLARGVQNVLCTRWVADDAMSAILVTLVAERWLRGVPASVALAQTIRDVIQGRLDVPVGLQHPFHWANLCCWGVLPPEQDRLNFS